MPYHKQVPITLESGRVIEVDKGLEDVIKLLNFWDFDTCNSCIDNGTSVWIEFEYYGDVHRLTQLSLKDKYKKNANFVYGGKVPYIDSLFDFLTEKGEFSLCVGEETILDPREKDTVIGTGIVEIGVSLRFPREDFKYFKKLLFEMFETLY